MIIEHTNEDFDYHYGLRYLDWKDKIILDLGADFGSTAKCFLEKGAKKVYAVEGDKELFIKLEILSNRDKYKGRIIPMLKFINTSDDLCNMINLYQDSDICKTDIETYEIGLILVPINILRKIKDYVIESHANVIQEPLIKRFKEAEFELKQIIQLQVTECRVLHLTRKDK